MSLRPKRAPRTSANVRRARRWLGLRGQRAVIWPCQVPASQARWPSRALATVLATLLPGCLVTFLPCACFLLPNFLTFRPPYSLLDYHHFFAVVAVPKLSGKPRSKHKQQLHLQEKQREPGSCLFLFRLDSNLSQVSSRLVILELSHNQSPNR